MTSIEVFTRFAKSQLYVREEGGANAGQVVREYLRTVGNKEGDPWCMAFISWCGKWAVDKWPLPMTAGVQVMVDQALKREIVYKIPLQGDLLVVYYEKMKRYAHVGLVTAVLDNRIKTIEGNTNSNGGREGYGVFERDRALSPNYKYIRWNSLV